MLRAAALCGYRDRPARQGGGLLVLLSIHDSSCLLLQLQLAQMSLLALCL